MISPSLTGCDSLNLLLVTPENDGPWNTGDTGSLGSTCLAWPWLSTQNSHVLLCPKLWGLHSSVEIQNKLPPVAEQYNTHTNITLYLVHTVYSSKVMDPFMSHASVVHSAALSQDHIGLLPSWLAMTY